MKLVYRILRVVGIGLTVPLVMLAACQHRLLYFPRPYAPGESDLFTKSGGKIIEVDSDVGKQVGWLLAPKSGKPEHFWIICGGNGTLALEMAQALPGTNSSRDAYLFFDYPGYGMCEGKTSPSAIKKSLRAVVPAALTACGLTPEDLPTRGIVFGHSLGAAVALLAADAFNISRAVMVSPFTSTPDMAKVVTRLPLGWLVYHRFDNRAGLRHLRARGGKAWIIHGDADTVIPVSMGRALAKANPSTVIYHEVQGGGHNDIFTLAHGVISKAMEEARQYASVPPAQAKAAPLTRPQ